MGDNYGRIPARESTAERQRQGWVERQDRGEKKKQSRSGIYHIMPCHASQNANLGRGLRNAAGRIGH